MVGVDVQALDHPLGTKLIDHGPGPSHPHLIEEYRRETGRDAMADFPHWEPAHKIMMIKGGIPGIENINGDLDAITGKRCTFMAFPVALAAGRRLSGPRRRGDRSGPAIPHRNGR